MTPPRPDLIPDSQNGGCACGGVRYRVAGPPMFVNCCHCTSCQTETGSAFAVNALWEAGRVQLTAGAIEERVIPSASGAGQTLAICPSCRVVLWSNYAAASPAVRFVRVGTLDRPAACAPGAHIYTRSKLSWMVLPEGVPVFEEFYPLKAVWPPESFARLIAAKQAS